MEGSNLASKVLKIDGNPRCNLLKKEEATRVSSIKPNLPLKADTAKRNQEAGHTHTTKSPTISDSSHAASVDPSKSDTAKGDPSNVVHATNFSQAVNPYAHAANDNSKVSHTSKADVKHDVSAMGLSYAAIVQPKSDSSLSSG
ncbi:hypothetical protein QVD17_24294 [Tagetes erecta]|uniref:Uncharacterized protein n=1 Tax=Tagetes erecta TaxID=13708 RepID=A0AAD8NUI0_TARER|nr:hypothetical protein QVD17_24294 [Tagetes erecta]